MTTYRLLFVDDDPDLLRAVGSYFEKLGHEVHRAESGEEALAMYDRVEPHVTVLDQAMPGMTGLDVLERLRRRQAMVIMLTGHGEVDTAVEAMRLGAENFLQKPIDMNHLQQAVEKAAEKSTLRREVVTLRARLPSLRKRTVQAIVIMVMVIAAVLLGLAIGRDKQPVAPPIPVPIQGGN